MARTSTHSQPSAGTSLVRELSALLKQRSQIDKKISSLESRFLKKVARQADLPKSQGERSPYPERMENENKLIDAIPIVMENNKKMRTQQVCDALQKSGEYNSNGERFYAMVNVRLSQLAKSKKSPVERVGRGLYQIPEKSHSREKKTNQSA